MVSNIPAQSTRQLRAAVLFTTLISCLLLFAVSRLHAGSYSQDFSAGTLETQIIGGGDTSTLSSSSPSTTRIRIWAPGNKALQMMSPLGGNSASWKMPDLDPGKEIQSFDATFNAGTYRTSPAAVPGAGWSLNFGAIPSGYGTGDGGFSMPNGIVIAWDIFNNGAGDNPSIEVFCAGVSVGNSPSTTLTDLPLPDGGTFTLTNPASGGTTGSIAFNAAATTVQAAMRAIVGWEVATVTGGSGGPWSINHGVVGAYSDPVSDTSGILPPNSTTFNITKTAAGTATTNEQWSIAQRAYRPRAVSIHWDSNGLDVSVNGSAIFTDLPTPGFAPAAGNKFAFSARCEASNTMDFFLDDVVLATSPLPQLETGGPVISEFMADNSATLEDEDADSPDWIEIFNGQNATVNLVGWRLTNAPGNHAMWTFPSISMAPYTYKIVYASGKNRTIATGQLHTNFTLQKESGYLALVKPDGVTIATEFTYGAQYKDVSYGEKGAARTLGYMQPATPGVKASYGTPQAAGGPAEDVVWSHTGGIITGPTAVTIGTPVAAGSVVTYTLNNSIPQSSSAAYGAAFNVTASTNLRARVFTPGMLAGPVSSRTFLLIDSSLTNYNGSGQVFSSNIPVIVFDSFGSALDGENGGSRPPRYTYAVVIDRNPLTGRASLTGLSDFQGRSGTHVHGESSAGFPQRSYNWETWDNADADKKVSFLGMPADSDWILHGSFSDKSVMRNHLVFSMMREMHPDYIASRSRQVEVFFNQEAGQPVSYADYRGVYTLLEKIARGKDRVDVQKLNNLATAPAALSGGYIFKKDKVDAGSTA
ncbi:MAG: CotH kinase family protein, partial [Chthoniobacteraceae bacterium]